MLDVIGYFLGLAVLGTVLAGAGILYFLPTIIVLLRRAHGMYAVVIVVNVLLGWTFIGWFVALVLSLVTFSSSHQHYYYAYAQAPPYQPVPATGSYLPGSASANGTSPEAAAVAAPPSEDA